MPTGGKKTTGTAKGSIGAKPKQPATSKPTKTDNLTQNNTSVGSGQDFLFTGQSPEQKEDEWLNKIKDLMKIKNNEVDESSKFSENLKRLYEALLKELSMKCEVKYKSMFDIADGGQPDTDMEVNVALRVNTKEKELSDFRVNTKEKELSDKLAESSAKYQELTEENNKLKDQLKSYQDNLKVNTKEKELSDKSAESSVKHQKLTEENNKLNNQLKSNQDNLKKVEKQAGDYKEEVDAKIAENNKLKQNISVMEKRILEIENQQKMTKPPEKTDDALNMLKDDTNENQEKTDSSNKEQIERLTTENKKLSSQTQQMQQKIDALTKEKADVLKQKENLEKGNENQEKTDSSNKELIERLTTENEKLSKQTQQMQQKIDALTKEKADVLKQKENLKKGNENQEKTDSSNKELIEGLTTENEKLSRQTQQMQQKIEALTKEKADVLKQKENLEKGLKDANTTLNKDNEKNKIKLEEGDKKRTALENENNDLKKQLQNLHDKLKGAKSEKKFAALGPDQKLKEVQEENEKLRDRLSKVAGMKLTEGNPAIADLGDPNRPTQLGEKFAEMYDNEWTDAMEELTNAGDEKSGINTLKTIVEKSYEFGKTRAASYVKGLEKAFLDLSNGIEVTDIISKYIKDHRKNTALLVLDGLYKSFVRDHKEYNVGGDGVKNFIKKAVSLCWLMAIQDPPVVLTTKLTGKFDTDRFRHYTKSGSTVDYVVWPVLFLHEGGPIICKGVAQGK